MALGTWLQILFVASLQVQQHSTMRWYDYNNFAGLSLFSDRVVEIMTDRDKPSGYSMSGVLIGKDHVLTSFNPFRELSRRMFTRNSIKIHILSERVMINDGDTMDLHHYITQQRSITCARQIIPMRAKHMDIWHWHGNDSKPVNSPVHDLMVMRLNYSVVFAKDSEIFGAKNFFKPEGKKGDKFFRKHGPLKTKIANMTTLLGREISFASTGFLSDEHVEINALLAVKEYYFEDNVVIDCDEWLPRDWGHFICIDNADNYPGITSGAILMYRETVFGIGSFHLRKGKKSILVFTDVRPYEQLLFQTCTELDGLV